MKTGWLSAAVLSVGSCAIQAQTGASAKTAGSCSPALNGNSNVITISCTGISAKKADDLLRVMNQILARQLDLKQVNDQLLQIHSEVENLSASLNPLDSASPAQSAFLRDATQVIVDCFNFSHQWGQLNAADYSSRANMNDVAAQESARYQSTFMPKAVLWRDKLLAQLPGVHGSEVDYSQVHNMQQLGGVCMDLNALGTQYKTNLIEELRTKRASGSK